MKLFLNGGGDGGSVADIRKKLNEVIDHTKKVLYVPLAWPDPTYKGCFEFMSNELADVEIVGIEMITSGDELASKDFKNYSFIYIGGGNTFKLLNDLKESKSFDKIRKYLLEEDGIVYGGSAGAIIFGRDLDSCRTDDKNDVNLLDISGFDMINGHSLLCHYTSRNEERTKISKDYLMELSKEKLIYAIPEEDSIIIENGTIEFIGSKPYYEFKNGNVIEYTINLNGKTL